MSAELLDMPADRAKLDAKSTPDFAQLFREHVSWLWRVVRRLGVRDGDVGDVVHDLFLDVHRSLATYDSSRPLRPWLYGFALRAASDYRRQAYIRRETPTAEPPEHGDLHSPEQALRATERRELVLQLLERMVDAQRTILVLVDLEDLPVTEVAQLLAVPLNTAYSRLRVARESFAALALQAQRKGDLP